MTLKRVTMQLAERDFQNAEELLKRFNAQNKAEVVSNALSITEGLTREVQNGNEIIIRRRDGALCPVTIKGI